MRTDSAYRVAHRHGMITPALRLQQSLAMPTPSASPGAATRAARFSATMQFQPGLDFPYPPAPGTASRLHGVLGGGDGAVNRPTAAYAAVHSPVTSQARQVGHLS